MGFFTAFRGDAYPKQPSVALPAAPGFSLTTARTLAWAAQLAYEVDTPAKFQRIIAAWEWQAGTRFVRQFNTPWRPAEAKGFVATAGGASVIAFAGTEPENLTEWLQDFTIWFAANGVHQGFEDGVSAAWPDLVNAARSATGGVYLTGHSLGAALAVAAASRLVEHNILPADRILGVYTIGMPRIGDAAYARAYDARLGTQTFRLIHGEDLATKVPPSVLLGYRHVGRWLASPRNGAFAGAPTNAPPPDDDILSLAGLLVQGVDNTAPGFPAENPLAVEAAALLPGTLRDHLTDGYLRALRGLT